MQSTRLLSASNRTLQSKDIAQYSLRFTLRAEDCLDNAMINLIFGSSFWTMFARFTLLPILFVVFSLTWQTIAAPFTGDPVIIEPIWMVAFNMVSLSWMGWGLAFWRFDPDGTPSRFFWVYPLISGLAFVPAMLLFVSMQAEPTLNERLLVSVFAAIAGPIMASVMVIFWRHAPNITALKKSDT